MSNLVIPHRCQGVRCCGERQQCQSSPAVTHQHTRFCTGGASQEVSRRSRDCLAFLSKLFLTMLLVHILLWEASWLPSESRCQAAVRLSSWVLVFNLSFCELVLAFFLPREELFLSQNTSDLSPVKEMKVWITITSGETIYKSEFKCFKSFFPLLFFCSYVTLSLPFLKETPGKCITATSNSLVIQSVHYVFN